MTNRSGFILFVFIMACSDVEKKDHDNALLIKNVTLIDGNGGQPRLNTDILIQGDIIKAIGSDLDSSGIHSIDYAGKTVMPALISGHTHIGNLKGTTTVAENYTRENVLAQLNKYARYGVLEVLVMGTDRSLLFENGFYDSIKNGLEPGARLYSAGRGFGTPGGMPPRDFAMDNVFRPSNTDQAKVQVDSLSKLKPALIKMWVDNGGGKFPTMDSAVSATIISQGIKHNLRTASHVYYQRDAKRLIRDGLKIIAHSIRDTIIDDELLSLMKSNDVTYIPTLTLDEYAYVYAGKPEWINDAFFRESLEPGVYEKISSEKYQQEIKNAPDYQKKIKAYDTALKNLEKIFKAGITVVMGTDSGANPIRTQGFSEHLELELMVKAGLTPLQAITAATKNASRMLEIGNKTGTLEPGKLADFIILENSPADNIRNTRGIVEVYKAGKKNQQVMGAVSL